MSVAKDLRKEKAAPFRRLSLRAWREPSAEGAAMSRRVEALTVEANRRGVVLGAQPRKSVNGKRLPRQQGTRQNNVGAASPRAKLQQHRDRLEMRAGDFLRNRFCGGWLMETGLGRRRARRQKHKNDQAGRAIC